MACAENCPTQNHSTYGECLRSKNIGTLWVQHVKGLDGTAEKNHTAELDAYRAARKEGIQPASTRMKDVETAVKISDNAGRPFDASTGGFKN